MLGLFLEGQRAAADYTPHARQVAGQAVPIASATECIATTGPLFPPAGSPGPGPAELVQSAASAAAAPAGVTLAPPRGMFIGPFGLVSKESGLAAWGPAISPTAKPEGLPPETGKLRAERWKLFTLEHHSFITHLDLVALEKALETGEVEHLCYGGRVVAGNARNWTVTMILMSSFRQGERGELNKRLLERLCGPRSEPFHPSDKYEILRVALWRKTP